MKHLGELAPELFEKVLNEVLNETSEYQELANNYFHNDEKGLCAFVINLLKNSENYQGGSEQLDEFPKFVNRDTSFGLGMEVGFALGKLKDGE